MSVGAVNKQTGDRIPTAGMPAIDSVLSGSSTNPVQNAIITAALADKQDKTDNNLTTTDKTTTGAINEVKSELTNKLDSSVYAQFGCKNLNAYPYFNTTKTSHDITFTDNGDGTVTATGQNDGTTCYFECHTFSESEQGTIKLPNGKYILNGCPTGGSSTTYFVTAQCVKNGSTTTLGTDFGSGVVLELNGDDYSPDTVDIQIRLVVYKNYNISDSLVFRPMIRPAGVADGTWEPYVKSNKQLTDGLALKQNATDNNLQTTDKTVVGAVNELKSGLTDVVSLFNSIFKPTSRLTAENDLDSVVNTGAYYFRDSDTPANAPASNCYIAVIRQYDNAPRIAQFAYSFSVNIVYVRRTLDWGSTWGDWYSLDMTQVTQ